MSDRIIAVDFDGTLCEDVFPSIGRENEMVISKLLSEQESGSKLILWTCREGERLEEAVAWCAERGLFFDAVNDNLPERIKKYGNNCRKIGATEYWDDKAVRVMYNND